MVQIPTIPKARGAASGFVASPSGGAVRAGNGSSGPREKPAWWGKPGMQPMIEYTNPPAEWGPRSPQQTGISLDMDNPNPPQNTQRMQTRLDYLQKNRPNDPQVGKLRLQGRMAPLQQPTGYVPPQQTEAPPTRQPGIGGWPEKPMQQDPNAPVVQDPTAPAEWGGPYPPAPSRTSQQADPGTIYNMQGGGQQAQVLDPSSGRGSWQDSLDQLTKLFGATQTSGQPDVAALYNNYIKQNPNIQPMPLQPAQPQRQQSRRPTPPRGISKPGLLDKRLHNL